MAFQGRPHEGSDRSIKEHRDRRHFLPTDTILGFGLAQIIALLILLVVCLVAGLIARSAIGKGLVRRIESGLLSAVPG